jgi:2-polyprenyl-3-methyl-5-hydroxy-6-metoxy-1,4-benzoquinol methylase
LVAVLHPRKVLDVGCARGFHVLAFKRLGIEVEGVENSTYALSKSPAEIRDFLHQVDLESGKLPFGPEQFDVVTMLEVIEHLKDFRHALSEVKRVMRHNSFFFITTPAPPSNEDPTHVSVYPLEIWRKVFHEIGLAETLRAKKLKTLAVLRFHLLLLVTVRHPMDILRAIHEMMMSILKLVGVNRSMVFLLVKE